MKLMIVEDEAHVRERIAEGIAWNEHGIELVAVAANGREALIALENTRMDVIVTDIYMPQMNGLELARLVRESDPLIKVIILTGYDDFEYAQESIELNVCKYLVKPADNEEILQAVLLAVAQRQQELLERHNMLRLEQRWQERLPQLRDTFYKNWFNGRYALWELQKSSEELQVELPSGRYLPVVLDMDPITAASERFTPDDRGLVQFQLFTVARDLIMSDEGVAIQDDDGMTAVLFFGDLAIDTAKWMVQVNLRVMELVDTVQECLKLTASAGIGIIVDEPQQVHRAFRFARAALHERVTQGNAIIVPYRDSRISTQPWQRLEEVEKELELALETGEADKARIVVDRIMNEFFSQERPVVEARETLWRFVCLFVRTIHKYEWTMQEALGEELGAFERFAELLTREQIEGWLLRMTARIRRTFSERRQRERSAAMQDVLTYIQQHLDDEELSLYQLAERMFISYSYLSRTFKESVGETFSEYVLKLRMQRAKDLLLAGCKVYDAAYQTGYKHVNYFSKAFIKYWGVKPSEIGSTVK